MNYGATYSTDPGSFGEITAVFEVEEGWDGFRFHGYCVPTDQEVEKFFSWPRYSLFATPTTKRQPPPIR